MLESYFIAGFSTTKKNANRWCPPIFWADSSPFLVNQADQTALSEATTSVVVHWMTKKGTGSCIGTRWCPPVISWFIIPLTIDISTISPSYWYLRSPLDLGMMLVHPSIQVFRNCSMKRLEKQNAGGGACPWKKTGTLWSMMLISFQGTLYLLRKQEEISSFWNTEGSSIKYCSGDAQILSEILRVIGSEVGWKESRFSLVGIFYGWWSVGIEDNLRIGSEKWRYKLSHEDRNSPVPGTNDGYEMLWKYLGQISSGNLT